MRLVHTDEPLEALRLSATLFDHTDRDGDALTVYKRAAHWVAEPIAVTINAEIETEQAGALTP